MSGLPTLGGLIRQLKNAKLVNILFAGSTSGTTQVQAPAAAGTGTVITLPAFTGTLATLAGTETLSGKTLTSPTVGGTGITMSAAASGINLKQGSNGKCGTFILNGATPVTVSNTSIAITDSIIISLNTVGGSVGVQPHVATITGATGFTVVGTASDTSTYNYAIISNAA